MSTIKVDTIQSRQHSASTINLTSTGATVNGDCTATTFSGSGASLTSIPAANLTGTLPAIDGSNLTGVGGGALEFQSKTTISTPTQIVDINPSGGLTAGIYKLIGKKVLFTTSDGAGAYGARVGFSAFLNGSSTFTSAYNIDYVFFNSYNYSNPRSRDQYSGFTLESDNTSAQGSSLGGYAYEFELNFSTDYYSWLSGNGHNLGSRYSSGWFHGHLSSHVTDVSANRISGWRIYDISGGNANFQAGTEFTLYKLKES